MRFLALLLLTGCGSLISHNPPPSDWPQLRVVIHKGTQMQVQKKCVKYLSPFNAVMSLGLVGGCAEVNFRQKRCDIWVPHDVSQEVLDHEMEHCKGKDHPTESTMKDAWERYKAGR